MPFKSIAQRTWMKINKPRMYKEWLKNYGYNIGGGGRRKTKKEAKKD